MCSQALSCVRAPPQVRREGARPRRAGCRAGAHDGGEGRADRSAVRRSRRAARAAARHRERRGRRRRRRRRCLGGPQRGGGGCRRRRRCGGRSAHDADAGRRHRRDGQVPLAGSRAGDAACRRVARAAVAGGNACKPRHVIGAHMYVEPEAVVVVAGAQRERLSRSEWDACARQERDALPPVVRPRRSGQVARSCPRRRGAVARTACGVNVQLTDGRVRARTMW